MQIFGALLLMGSIAIPALWHLAAGHPADAFFTSTIKPYITMRPAIVGFVALIVMLVLPAMLGFLIFIGYTIALPDTDLHRESAKLYDMHPKFAAAIPMLIISTLILVGLLQAVPLFSSARKSATGAAILIAGCLLFSWTVLWTVKFFWRSRQGEPYLRTVAMLFLATAYAFLLITKTANAGAPAALIGTILIAYATFRELQIRSNASATRTLCAILLCKRSTLEPDPTRCPHCAYPLTHLSTPRCPECGQPFVPLDP